MIKNLLVRAGVAVLGVVVMLAWWSFRGDDGKSASADRIPAKVWNGGGGTVTIEIETTTAARMSVSFTEEKEDGRSLNTWEVVQPGARSWTIDVPANVSGYIDLVAEKPQIGDKLSWKVKVNGQVVDEQSESLQEALRAGYAFGIQVYLADYATGKLEEDD